MTPEYVLTTQDITVTVTPVYLDDDSIPSEGHFVWAYHVRISNEGREMVRLVNRYWHITDGHGQVQEVRGSGVVGQQPDIAPGGAYEYASGAQLTTPSGIMTGAYEMVTESGESIIVAIPSFSLDSSEQVQRPN